MKGLVSPKTLCRAAPEAQDKFRIQLAVMTASPHPRVFIVHNPVAGTSDPDNVRAVFQDRLASQGGSYEVHETSASDNVAEIVRQAEARGYDAIWAAGGDGTVSGVANGLINRPTPLGIVPIGTGNALARELGIPLDIQDACDLLVGENTGRRIDAMKVGEAYYVLAVGVGISSLTMVETSREQKRRFGRIAYVWNGLRHVLAAAIWRFSIMVDDRPVRVRATEIAVTNAQILGVKPMGWGPDVSVDDGQVDLCHVRTASLTELLRSVAGLALSQPEAVPEIECFPVRSYVQIHSRRRLPVQGDGEAIGHTPVRIDVVEGALNVLTPLHSQENKK